MLADAAIAPVDAAIETATSMGEAAPESAPTAATPVARGGQRGRVCGRDAVAGGVVVRVATVGGVMHAKLRRMTPGSQHGQRPRRRRSSSRPAEQVPTPL